MGSGEAAASLGDHQYATARAGSMPAVRVLAVLEFAHRKKNDPFTLSDLAMGTGLAKATLLRVIRTLSDAGYLIDTGSAYRSNLFFDVRLPASQQHAAQLDQVLQELAKESGLTVEVLTIRTPDLYWFDKRAHPALQVRVVAEPGTTRTLYELDAPSRVYLSARGLQFVQEELLPGFFHQGPQKRRLSEPEALRIIRETDSHDVVFDREGNLNGIRRYVVAIRSPEGAFRYLLSIAEPALPQNDRPEHIQRVFMLLRKARDLLNEIY